MAVASVQRPFLVPKPATEPDLLAKYFKVLADPTRVRILELLRDEGELCVSELTERLGLGQSNVSNHLACLRWCGFAATRRAHRVVYYSVADERVLGLLDLGRDLLAGSAEHVAHCGRVGGGEPSP
jgi:ArsR family transcriptional regulator